MTRGRGLPRCSIDQVIVAVILASLLLPLVAGLETTKAAAVIMQQATEQAHPFGEPTAPLAERHIYDLANALNEAERLTINADAGRLQGFGIPALIITVTSDMSPEEAARVAASVRQDWDVASEPGADDGLVFLVVLPNAEQGDTFATLSWGANALPNQGFTAIDSEHIYQRWIGIWLSEPQVFEAVTYGLRRMIYHVIYEPTPPEPLSDARQTAQAMLRWLAPLIAIGFGVMRFARFYTAQSRFTSSLPGWLRELVPFLLSLILGIVSVWAQSSIGVICTGLVLTISVIGWIRHDPIHIAQPPHAWRLTRAGRSA